MLNKLFIVVCIVFFLGHSLMAQEPRWLTDVRKIIPLKSVKQDVRDLYGKPTNTYADVEEYRTKKGLLTITYSTGECSSPLSSYNVTKETVVDIDFLLYKGINFNIIKDDISSFVKEKESDGDAETYKNYDMGIIYSIYIKFEKNVEFEKRQKILSSLTILPPRKYDYLECLSGK